MTDTSLGKRLDEIHARYLGGSRTAPRDLVGEALEPLQRLVRSRVHGLSEEDARDAATDAIMSYLDAPGTFDPARGASLWTYLGAIALNKARDTARRAATGARAIEKLHDAIELWHRHANNLADVEVAMDAEQIRPRLDEVARTEDEQRALALMIEGERSTEAYAAALGLAPDAAETAHTVKKVKDRLKARMKKVRDGR